MLNIGIFELLLIFIVGMIFLSPKDLVACIKFIKKIKAKVSHIYHTTGEYFQEVTELDEDIPSLIHKGLKQPSEHIHKMFNYEFLPKNNNATEVKEHSNQSSEEPTLPNTSDSNNTPKT